MILSCYWFCFYYVSTHSLFFPKVILEIVEEYDHASPRAFSISLVQSTFSHVGWLLGSLSWTILHWSQSCQHSSQSWVLVLLDLGQSSSLSVWCFSIPMPLKIHLLCWHPCYAVGMHWPCRWPQFLVVFHMNSAHTRKWSSCTCTAEVSTVMLTPMTTVMLLW